MTVLYTRYMQRVFLNSLSPPSFINPKGAHTGFTSAVLYMYATSVTKGWACTVGNLHKRYNSWKSQHVQLLCLPRSFLFHCFPLSTSVKQSSASPCDLLNSPFHQNEIVERATWRRSKVEVLDENREGSWISLAATKHYKVIHSPAVRKKKKPNQQPPALLQ